MRIPTYQQKNTYQRLHLPTNELAKPILEQDGVQQQQRELLGHLISGIGGKIAGILAQQKKKEPQDTQKKMQETERFSSFENDAATGAVSLSNAFSSPKRQQLYAFGQQQLAQASLGKNAATQSFSDSVTTLDEFFGQQATENQADFSSQKPDSNLLVQDYSILRQEISHLQQAQQSQEEKEAFARGAGQFIQTAGLIRTPGALEQYIQANLSAAETEYGTLNGTKKENWEGQKKQLYTQAVAHNIEAAVQAGEVEQAAQVYDYFKAHFSDEAQRALQAKLDGAQAVEKAGRLAPLVYQHCVSEQGEIQSQKIAEQVHVFCPGTAEKEKQICQALESSLADEAKRRLQQESKLYLALLNTADNPQESRRLLTSWQGTDKQLRQAEKLALALHQPQKNTTEPAVFNDLQYGIYYGQTDQKKIDEAFDAGELSAADTLRLKSRCCQARTSGGAGKDKVLLRAVYRLCHQAELEPYATEEVVYTVFSAGEDTQTRVQTAQELKKWLML